MPKETKELKFEIRDITDADHAALKKLAEGDGDNALLARAILGVRDGLSDHIAAMQELIASFVWNARPRQPEDDK